MIRHPFDRDDIDLNKLRADLAVRLGRPVELLTSEPTEDEPDGVLVLEDPDTGQWLDVDPVAVAEVVAAQVPATPPLTPEAEALAALESATTLVAVRAVFRGYLARAVADQAVARDRLRFLRRRRRRDRLGME